MVLLAVNSTCPPFLCSRVNQTLLLVPTTWKWHDQIAVGEASNLLGASPETSAETWGMNCLAHQFALHTLHVSLVLILNVSQEAH